MKKLLFGLTFLGSMMMTGVSFETKASVSDPSDGEDCVESIRYQGELIYVTVCNRKTSFLGSLAGLDCNKTSTTACTFTNAKNP
ncbi:hypothetical protein [Algoriphagus zhangzhouensis]|uniref:Uncharacterized protein n=1 Tax=Algoriphagus zhangzhouensis TaxID=1073327 RepID=A0A1M7Z9P5_9BACT|nr:hypothetical protein [Algoriphagus zhangzhouensis]TDY47364.1 hypothetical protein A8938_1818 [Algoriphagus zhangzhouensis]SHO61594.1 hypothetical protein SAMN04488108_1444 [Algoriphagus zhangzhouensis]